MTLSEVWFGWCGRRLWQGGAWTWRRARVARWRFGRGGRCLAGREDTQSATLPQKFSDCIELIRDDQAVSAYRAAQRQLDKNLPERATPSPRPHGGGTGGLNAVMAVIAMVGAGAGTGAFAVRRRRRRVSPFVTPRSVFAAARTATESELRVQAQQQVIDLGELVEQPGPLAAAAASPRSEQAQAQIARALDAYQAAGKVLDAASGICDLAGVLVLTHLGRNAAAIAQALQSGLPAPATHPLCFFNPLHGDGVHEIHWRPLGKREALDVHACPECAAAAAQHRLPDVLVDHAGGQEIPYYEADRERSVWAATGYGQFGNDLVERILTGQDRHES